MESLKKLGAISAAEPLTQPLLQGSLNKRNTFHTHGPVRDKVTTGLYPPPLITPHPRPPSVAEILFQATTSWSCLDFHNTGVSLNALLHTPAAFKMYLFLSLCFVLRVSVSRLTFSVTTHTCLQMQQSVILHSFKMEKHLLS